VENPLRTEAGAFRVLLYVIAVAVVVIVISLLV
jgi:hypothetical protein